MSFRSANASMLTYPRTWFWITLPLLLALHVVSCLTNPWCFQPPKPNTDGPDYENIGFNLSLGRGFAFDWSDPRAIAVYQQSELSKLNVADVARSNQWVPTTARPPLLPWLIGAIYTFVPRGPWAFATIRILLAVCLAVAGALSVALAVAILARTKQQKWLICTAGLATLLLALSDRNTRNYSSDFLTEPLALMLTQLFAMSLLFGILSPIDRKSESSDSGAVAKHALWSGFLLATMVYARSLFVFWIPGIWLLIAFASTRDKLRERWMAASLTITITLLCLAPWWIRNCLVLRTFLPLGTQGAITMLGGYSDQSLAAGGDWQYAPESLLRNELEQQETYLRQPDPIKRELIVVREASERVKRWIAAHVQDLPRLFVNRIITHWNPYHGRSLLWKLAMLFGVCWLFANRQSECWVLVGLPLLNTCVVMLLYTTGGRFLVPLYGLLYALAGIGIAGSIGWLSQVRKVYWPPR